MNEARKAGLPIVGEKFLDEWVVPKHNPDGYWEVEPKTVMKHLEKGTWDNHIVKLWGVFVEAADISRIVVLERRDKKKQLNSIAKVMWDELQLNNLRHVETSPEEFMDVSIMYMNNTVSNIPDDIKMHVYSEDINEELENILTFMKGGLSWV